MKGDQKSANLKTSTGAPVERPVRKPRQVSGLGKFVTTLHNITQAVGWFILFGMAVCNLYKDFEGTYFNPRKNCTTMIYLFKIVQSFQALEILYAIIGWSQTSVIAAFNQMFGRLFFAFISLELTNDYIPCSFIPLLMFFSIEIIRYPFYLLKQAGAERSALGRFFGWLRYTAFIPIYPTGASTELLTAIQSIPAIRSTSPKMYSVEMPNTFNYGFDMEYFIYLMIPLYVFGFPGQFKYMLTQRAKYFQTLKESQNIFKKIN